MTDIPTDIGTLARAIANQEIKSTSDLKRMTDMLRALAVDMAEVYDLGEHTIRTALIDFDNGARKRAWAVTRSLRHSQAMFLLAGRRCVATWRAYQKQYSAAINPQDSGKRSEFDPTK